MHGALYQPEWMPEAERAARQLRATTAGTRGAHHALYDLRFDQHKTGYKASRHVNRFGVRLLPQLFEHFNPLRRWEAVELEPALAEAFRHAGVPWVEGGH
jgi:glycine/D-amino acid oxidase-like deaminating enzyme